MKRVIKPVFVAGAFLVFSMLPTTLPPKRDIISFSPPLLTKERGLGGEVETKSALVFDLLTGETLFEKNIEEPLPLASLSKIISSLVVVENIPLGEYITISKSAVETEEPSTLRVGEHIRTEDLLAMAMGESSNDAMMALVEHLGDGKWFVELMNEKAKKLGAETTSFLNPTGLDLPPPLLSKEGKPTSPQKRDDISFSPPLLTKERGLGGEVASNFGSAYDLAQIIKNSLDSIIWQVGNKEEIVSKEGIVHKIKHTNILRKELNGIYGAKTGFTDLAGGNLVLIVERPVGKPKAIIILGSTLEGRFEDAKKLIELF